MSDQKPEPSQPQRVTLQHEGKNFCDLFGRLWLPHAIRLTIPHADVQKWFDEWHRSDSARSRKIKIVDPTNRNRELYNGYVTLWGYTCENHDPQADLRLDSFKGTSLCQNWIAHQRELQPWYIEETYLYADMTFAGEIRNLGPFDLFNLVPRDRNLPYASLALRAVLYESAFMSTRTANPHKALSSSSERQPPWYAEEIAAIISVLTGVRMKAGGIIRHIGAGSDHYGRPCYAGQSPHLPDCASDPKRQIVPTYSQWTSVHMTAAEVNIRRYFALPVALSSSFARASLHFQKALWCCEDDPELSWIWLVGACETLAEASDTPETAELADEEVLDGIFTNEERERLGNNACSLIAGRLRPMSKARQKLLAFLDTYRPGPPPTRPAAHACVEWESVRLRKVFNTLYKYRSDYLHAGFSFPWPMCQPPEWQRGEPVPSEKLVGMVGNGSTWFEADSCPMHLHIFFHVVRGAMVSWLEAQRPSDEGAGAPRE